MTRSIAFISAFLIAACATSAFAVDLGGLSDIKNLRQSGWGFALQGTWEDRT